MEKVERLLAKFPLLIIFLLSIPAIAALAVSGFYGASDDLHIAWLQQMDKIIREGQFPPRFVPDLSYGFGYPLFNFVFPLPFYIAEAFHLLGFSLVDSIKLLFGLTIPLSGYFMYKLLKQYAGVLLSLAGSVLYMYTPYRSTDIYVRGAIGEIVAFVFLPLIILSVIKITKKKADVKPWIGILALSTAALVLSHNIMAYMFFPFVLLFVVVRVFTLSSPRLLVLIRIIFGLVLGLLISIYFWLPAIVESRLLKYDTVFNYKDHFPTIRQLLTPYFGYGASVAGPYDGMSFFIGLVNLLMVFVGIWGLLVWRNKIQESHRMLLVWAIVIFLISVFMMNFRSSFIWDSIPLIPYFQFPWRFLSLITFVTPLMVIPLQHLRHKRSIGIGIILLTIGLNYNYFKPHDFLGRGDDYYLNRYIPFPTASFEYKQISEEYLRLPLATEVRPDSNFGRISVVGAQPSKVIYKNSLDTTFEIETKSPATVIYYKYLFPGWYAKIDGEQVSLNSGRPYGQVVFDVPPGSHKVKIGFKETDFRMVLNVISLLSFVGALGLTLTKKVKYEQR